MLVQQTVFHMHLVFSCAQCGQILKALESAAGRVIVCPKCKAKLVAPLPEAPEPPPKLPAIPAGSDDSYSVQAYRSSPPVYSEPEVQPTPEQPKKKKPRKLSQDERLLAEEIPWFVRHLHWLLLLALLPLIASLLSKPIKFDLEERLRATLDQLTDNERDDIDDELDHLTKRHGADRLFSLFPQRKLIGAWLPRDSSMHWLLAGATGFFFLQFFVILSIRTTAKPWQLVLVALFTATLGILILEMVQIISIVSQSLVMGGPAILVVWPFKLIGFMYLSALDESSGFARSLMGFILGVGLCEELIKLLPVFLYLKLVKKANWHGAFLWGLSSGAGFGIAEAMMYSTEYYHGILPGSVYFLRFISCVALHAIWSGSVAITLYLLQGKWKQSPRWTDRVALILVAILVPMILHGCYDTFLKKELQWAALLIALLSFAFLAYLDHALQRPEILSFLRRTKLAKV